MGPFTKNEKRTTTAICQTDVTLSLIIYEGFEQLYFQNPEFWLYLVRLTAKRFQNNLYQLDGDFHDRGRERTRVLQRMRAEDYRLEVAPLN